MEEEPKKPGPKPRDKALFTGAAVEALALTGVSPGQIAEELGMSISLVDDILNGKGKWATLKTDQALQQYRQKQTRQHELMARELSTKALERIEVMIPKASLSQAVIAFGVLQDKARLLAGESTQNISFGGTVRMESEKLTDMLAKLVSSLSHDTGAVEVPVTEAEVVVESKVKEEPPCTTTTTPDQKTGLGLADDIG
jgi:hypothetical protein